MDDIEIVFETYEESDKIEVIELEQESNSENIDVVEVASPSRVGYHSLPNRVMPTKPKEKKCYTVKRKTNLEKLLSAVLPKRENLDLKSDLELNRPILPKPLQRDDSSVDLVPKHTFKLQPNMMNMPSTSNCVFISSTVPVEENITPSDNNTINKSNTNKSNSNLNDSYSDNSSCRKNSSSCDKKCSPIRIIIPHKNSIELFFESMAQTVSSLPTEVQSRIKMEICELVTKAEIKYHKSQAKSKTEN